MLVDVQEELVLAAAVLDLGKKLVPDRFPQPSDGVVAAWGEVLGSVNVPPDVWLDAVRLWSTEFVGDRMVTPRELKRAAKVVLDRWESDPVMKRRLDARRERLREERDRQIAAGTFGSVRGYRPVESSSGGESVSAPDMLRELRDSVARKRGV